jgi:hypothetical protein
VTTPQGAEEVESAVLAPTLGHFTAVQAEPDVLAENFATIHGERVSIHAASSRPWLGFPAQPIRNPLRMNPLIGKFASMAEVYARWGKKIYARAVKRVSVGRFLQRHRGPVAIRFHSAGNGLFAHLSWCLHAAAWAERANRTVVLRCSSPQYSSALSGEDWLPTLLRQPGCENLCPEPPEVVVREYEQLPFYSDPLPATIAQARACFRGQFALADSIEAARTSHSAALFAGESFPIGLHYRGTDKSIEAPRVDLDEVVESARRALWAARSMGVGRPVLFVASDEESFVPMLRSRLPKERVLCLEGVLRSRGTPLHKAKISAGERLAREAMLDCLLLGQCRVLIKTASMLSAWSVILGNFPSVVMLSKPFTHCMFFPDNLAVQTGLPPGREAEAVRQSLNISSAQALPA